VRESEERFRTFISATSNVVYRMSPDWSEMRYLDGQEFIADTKDSSRTWVDKYIHRDDQHHVMAVIQRAIQSKTIFELEHRVIRTDGSLGWIYSRAIPIFAGHDEILEWFGSASDVTQRKQAEEALREQQERAEFVADASDVGFWFCDLPFDKLAWDKRVKNHFWLPPDADVTIHTFYERLHPEDREPTRRAMERSIANNTQYDVEYRTVAPDGRQNWIRAIGRTFYDAAGQPTRFDGVTLNVTDRKKSELALSASEARYRVLAEGLDQQVQARTLELQSGNREILRMYESLRTLSTRMMTVQDEERRRIARDLHDSSGQLLAVIDMQLSTLAQDLRKAAPQFNEQVEETERLVEQLQKEIRTTSYLLHPPLLDEAGLFSALSWYVEGLNKRSNVQITLEIAPNFGRLPRDIELVVFRLVQESLANIYRHSGSETAMIRIARDEGTITVEVQDHGKGIPPQKLLEIQSEGSGVGIRGMRERLRQFSGELRIESGENGTRVWVTISIPQTPVSKERTRTDEDDCLKVYTSI
jgi:PAS domain S-box-containing protein